MELEKKSKEELIKIINEMTVDRVKDWNDWAEIMKTYIAGFTVKKYGKTKNFDLMTITDPKVCMWNILKYGLRCFFDNGKIHDLHKISHYAQMAFTLSKGDLTKVGITNQKGD